MVKTVISIDPTKSGKDQPNKFSFHNRWHPDIPAVVSVAQNEVFRVECQDCSGGQIKNNDDARDILEADFSQIHYLSGPISVEGAEIGDALEVEILDVQPIEGHEWGFTCICDKTNGGSFLQDYFPKATKTIWDLEGIYCTSRHISGVKFAGIPHPGIIGTAPSTELLQEWNKREMDLIESSKKTLPGVKVALPPNVKGALLGSLEGKVGCEEAKAVAASTLPPRENGGNCDIKNLSRGSKVWLPVFVPGGNLSIGDIHYSQGDGEIALCGGIEMCGAVTLKVKVLKNGIKLLDLKNPIFLPGPVQPNYSRFLTFEGISVNRETKKQHFLDATLGFKNACLNAIEYLKKFGYSGEQACTILAASPCEGRINSIVDVPNACCSMAIPIDIFDFEVMPKAEGPKISPKGNVSFVLPKK